MVHRVANFGTSPARRWGFCLLWGMAMILSPVCADAERLRVKLGTLAPEGSAWHDALLEIRDRWRKSSDGNVELRIYPGGALGGETEMVRKVQRGGLDVVTISGSGLSFIDRNIDCLALPLMLDSYEELDYVRTRMTPKIEQILAQRGFKLLHWADAGWIYFFSKAPVRTPADLRRLRLWIGTGQPHLELVFKQLGLNVVPLPATEMLTALQTGLIDAFDVPPLFVLLDGSYRVARYMTDMKWAPLNAATLISTRMWNRIPDRYKEKLIEDARQVAGTLRDTDRGAHAGAVAEMEARGLNIVTPSAQDRAIWQADAEQAYSKLRNTYIDADLLDEVLRLRSAYRSAVPPPAR